MTYFSCEDSVKSIALVDDDKILSAMLSEYLQQQGFLVDCYFDGEAALHAIKNNQQYQVIVLDIMMPKINGLDVLQQIRQRIQTPVIMVTGRGDDIDKILGLELGADDYLSKPCNPRELLARINALMRRNELSRQEHVAALKPNIHLVVGELNLNKATRVAEMAGNSLPLTSVEFSILQHLMQASGTVVSKEELSRQVLHRELSAYDRSIDVHVSRIRKKIEMHHGSTSVIKTLRGRGYLFVNENE